MKRFLTILTLCVAVAGYGQNRDASKRGTAVRLTPRETQTALISGEKLVKTAPNTVRLSFDIALPKEYVRRKEACIIYPYIVTATGDNIALMPLAIAGDTYYKVYNDTRKMDFIRYEDDEYMIRYSAEAIGDFENYEPGFKVMSVRSRVGDNSKKGSYGTAAPLLSVEPETAVKFKETAPAAALPVNKVLRVEFGQDPDYDSRGFSPSDRSSVKFLVDQLDSLNRSHRIVITRISIFSAGAPFGEEKDNKELTEKRIRVIKNEIAGRCPSLSDRITEESVPENWAGFRALVEASSLENKESVLYDIDCIKNVQLRKIALKKQPNYEDVHELMKKSRVCIVDIDYTEMQKEKQL